MNFRTKAQTLLLLKDKVKSSNILQLEIIKGKDYYLYKNKTVEGLQYIFPERELIVRSSYSAEDTYQSSEAGKYLSVLNVDSSDGIALEKAIDSVFDSYKTDAQLEEVLVQPMLNDLKLSGVALTCDSNTGAPYYIINYLEGGDSTAVTSGKKSRTFIVCKNKKEFVNDKAMLSIILALEELQTILDEELLDVEFGITGANKLYIFQARPVASVKTAMGIDRITSPLDKIYKKIEKLMRPHPFLDGSTTCFGVMPDWNPAEILGARPKKLAISLYKELVTDSIWARQRYNYGYRDLTLHPLMISFCGIPYIDVRISFNSFIPKALHPQLSKKLADYYIQKFRKYPALHDKVEFEIVHSCYYFGLAQRLKELLQHGFTENEIKRIEFSLLNLTNDIINPENCLYRQDIANVSKLIDNNKAIMDSNISVIDKIYWLIEECKSYGTLPFAGVARAGFIAVQFLKSFVTQGIFTDEEYDRFMRSLRTISKELSTDRHALGIGKMSREEFLEKYGHIRPDTYNILSKRYDEAFDVYFKHTNSNEPDADCYFAFSQEQMAKIQYELDQNGLLLTAKQLIDFIKAAIEGREYVKFIFTRTVSEILNLIKKLGERLSIAPEDMAHLDVGQIKRLYVDLYYGNLEPILRNDIEVNKRQYECAATLKLPSVILEPKDVYSFYLLEEEPNFITAKTVIGEIVRDEYLLEAELENKIIFISAADPGYDFLFAKNIAGLVTEFGGVNSHMAIRCAEMGIPAVIGAGTKNYNEWKHFESISIDCLNHKVNGVN